MVIFSKTPVFNLIEHKTFTGAIPPTFSNLGDYEYLILVVDTEKGGTSGSDNTLRMRFNGDSGGNYSERQITNVSVSENTGGVSMKISSAPNRQCHIKIFVNARHSIHSIIMGGTGTSGANKEVISGTWSSGSAITSISFLNDGGDSADGDTGQMTLYGVRVS